MSNLLYAMVKRAVRYAPMIAVVLGVGFFMLRVQAFNPQDYMALDGANSLKSGIPLTTFLPQSTVLLDEDVGTYMFVVNPKGETVASTARLDGAMIAIDESQRKAAQDTKSHRFVLRKKGIPEQAIVLSGVEYNGGQWIVGVGRSMQPINQRWWQFIGYVAGISVLAIAIPEFIAMRPTVTRKKNGKKE